MNAFAHALATGVLLLATSLGLASPAAAQDSYPSRPIKLIMPVPPGSGPDIVARMVSEPLGKHLGQTVVVENRPGAGGLIAAQAVTSAASDGYTLLGGSAAVFTILPVQKEKLTIDVNRDLVQIGMLVNASLYLAVAPGLGVKSFADFVALARRQPGKIMIGTNGVGTLPHYTAVALANKANMPVTVVPYSTGGVGEAIRDIMGGRVHGTIEALAAIRGAVQSGNLTLIGIMSPAREPPLKDVPAVAETVPGFTSSGFMTLAAPAGTPEQIVTRVNAALAKALQEPAVSQRLTELGMPPRIMTPAETKAFIEDEQKTWWPIVRETPPN